MLSEISQSREDKYCMIPLLGVTRGGEFTETEAVNGVVKGWKEKGIGSY